MNPTPASPEGAPPAPVDQRRSRRRSIALILGTAVVAFLVAIGGLALLVTIIEHKQEARNPFFRVVEISDTTQDPEIWGKNFPLQYDDYLRTTDQVRTRYGGSEALPRTPTDADPRSIVAQSRLEEDPRLKTMWDGYAFARDFREDRGHAYMLDDQTYTERQAVGQPGTCLHCHSSIYVPAMQLGEGDLMKGWDLMSRKPFHEARALVEHPVACIDCHEPDTLQLRITRPAFIEGIRVLKEHQGVANFDVNADATRQEMRTYVCAQCHVEYYFHGPEKKLVYPWRNGLEVEDIMAYYDEIGFRDWTHKTTGAPMLKAQHPEFELWSQGVHARSGVACADCHMPYKRVGAHKISDHHVRSPLLNVQKACQTCHNWPEGEILARAQGNQERTFEMRDLAMNALMDLILDLRTAQGSGVATNDPGYVAALDFQRRATFYLDFVEAENSTGFHAPQEAVSILGRSIDFSRKGQNALRDAQRGGAPREAASAPELNPEAGGGAAGAAGPARDAAGIAAVSAGE